jgi:hypothetical protein
LLSNPLSTSFRSFIIPSFALQFDPLHPSISRVADVLFKGHPWPSIRNQTMRRHDQSANWINKEHLPLRKYKLTSVKLSNVWAIYALSVFIGFLFAKLFHILHNIQVNITVLPIMHHYEWRQSRHPHAHYFC